MLKIEWQPGGGIFQHTSQIFQLVREPASGPRPTRSEMIAKAYGAVHNVFQKRARPFLQRRVVSGIFLPFVFQATVLIFQ